MSELIQRAEACPAIQSGDAEAGLNALMRIASHPTLEVESRESDTEEMAQLRSVAPTLRKLIFGHRATRQQGNQPPPRDRLMHYVNQCEHIEPAPESTPPTEPVVDVNQVLNDIALTGRRQSEPNFQDPTHSPTVGERLVADARQFQQEYMGQFLDPASSYPPNDDPPAEAPRVGPVTIDAAALEARVLRHFYDRPLIRTTSNTNSSPTIRIPREDQQNDPERLQDDTERGDPGGRNREELGRIYGSFWPTTEARPDRATVRPDGRRGPAEGLGGAGGAEPTAGDHGAATPRAEPPEDPVG